MSDKPIKKKKHKKWIWIVLVVVILAVVLMVLNMGNQAKTSLQEATAARRDIVTYYSFSGNLTPVSDDVQAAEYAGKVKELYVQEGDLVKKDDRLMRFGDGSRIRASYDGTVETLYVKEDDQVQLGSQLVRIVDYQNLEVSVNVDEYDIDAITLGKEGTVYLNALGRSIPGRVTEIARNATTEGGVSYYPIKLEIEAPEDVRSGMSVEVNILNKQALDAVALPLNVISYNEDNKPYVMLMDEQGQVTVQIIETGVSDGQYVEVLSGLEDGQTVYYSGNDMARFYAMQQSMMGGGRNQ